MRIITILRTLKHINAMPREEAQVAVTELKERVRAAIERSGAMSAFTAQAAGYRWSAVSAQPLLTECNGPAFELDYLSLHSSNMATSLTFWLLNGQFQTTVRLLHLADGAGLNSTQAEILTVGRRQLADVVATFSVENQAITAVERGMQFRLHALEALGFAPSPSAKKGLLRSAKHLSVSPISSISTRKAATSVS